LLYLPRAYAQQESEGMFETDGLSCQTLLPLMRAFARAHVSDSAIDASLIENTSDQFVKRIDPSKNLLFETDVKNFQDGVREFMKNSRIPDCTKLHGLLNTLVDRSKGQLDYARKALGKDYKFNDKVEIIIDAKKRNYAKNQVEANERLLKNIHFQISTYLLNDMKLDEAKSKLVHRYELNLKRINEFSRSDLYDALLNSFASALDPHSSYLGKEVLEDFQIAMSLSLEGIGASLISEDGYTVIQELIPGGAAARSKLLEPKDKILSVSYKEGGKEEMKDVIDMDLRNVVKLIRGPSGSTVKLNILRQGKETSTFTISLKRSKVTLEDEAVQVTFQESKVGGNKVKLAHLILPSFYGDNELKKRSCYTDMVEALKKIEKEKVDGVMLDFSRNSGGRLEEAVRIAGLFFRLGNVVATKDSRKRIQKLADEDSRTQYSGPLVILTSRFSASAAEIVAGALKDYKRAVIVGADHTYGKGSVQAVLPLPSIAGAIKVTTGLFFLPGGKSTQHSGVDGDIVMPSILATDDIGEKGLDNSLKPQAISAFLSPEVNDPSDKNAWQAVTSAEIESLRVASEKRVKSNKKFDEVLKELAELNENKGVVNLAEFRKKSSERKGKDAKDEKKTSKQLVKERSEPQVNEAMSILSDLIAIRKGWNRDSIATAR
jgi:carboxyl-terminal processing protease